MAKESRIYKKVLDQMLDLIHSGAFPAGGRLPPERELAERFNVSRPTIREAIIALETLDYVDVRRLRDRKQPDDQRHLRQRQRFRTH